MCIVSMCVHCECACMLGVGVLCVCDWWVFVYVCLCVWEMFLPLEHHLCIGTECEWCSSLCVGIWYIIARCRTCILREIFSGNCFHCHTNLKCALLSECVQCEPQSVLAYLAGFYCSHSLRDKITKPVLIPLLLYSRYKFPFCIRHAPMQFLLLAAKENVISCSRMTCMNKAETQDVFPSFCCTWSMA